MKKLLIIRFSSIGDIVLTSPVIRCIKQQLHGVELHYLTKRAFSGILSKNPGVDKVFEYDTDPVKVISQLKDENYDLIIDLHHNLMSAKVKLALGIRASAFKKLNIEKWIMVNFKVDLMPKTHIVNRYMATLPGKGIYYDGNGLDFFIDAVDELSTATLPSPYRDGYVAFVIGAKHFTKRLPNDRIIEIINKMKLPVILLGGKEDAENAGIISNTAASPVYDTCGKLTLYQSASLIKQSRLVITHDTGLMHIAAAFRQRIISVWGNTIPEFGMYPLLPDGEGESAMFEVKELSCRPCTKIGFAKCPLTHFNCMNNQDIDRIAAKANEWW